MIHLLRQRDKHSLKQHDNNSKPRLYESELTEEQMEQVVGGEDYFPNERIRDIYTKGRLAALYNTRRTRTIADVLREERERELDLDLEV